MMSIEKQVCSFSHSVAFFRAGIKQEASFYWTSSRKLISFGQLPFISPRISVYAAYTIAEMGKILPWEIEGYFFEVIKNQIQWIARYTSKDTNKSKYVSDSATLANAIGQVLLQIAKDKLINKLFLEAA